MTDPGRSRPKDSRAAAALRDALLATLLLRGADSIERKWLGHRPPFHTAKLGQRLFGSARAGEAMRWVYGPSLALLQGWLGVPALVFGPAVACLELVALPLSGATPQLRRWKRGEIPLLFAHATAFAALVGLLAGRRALRAVPL